MGNREKKFKMQMTKDSLYDFMLHHSYSGLTGIFSIVFSIAFLIAGVVMYAVGRISISWMVALIVIAAAMAFSTPFQLRTDAARQMRNNQIYREPVTFSVSDRGIAVIQNKNKKFFTWKEIRKVRITKKAAGFYYERQYALVMTRTVFDEQGVLEIVQANMPEKDIKILK